MPCLVSDLPCRVIGQQSDGSEGEIRSYVEDLVNSDTFVLPGYNNALINANPGPLPQPGAHAC